MRKLYFGKVAPTEPQQDQVDGGGWGWRYKVRIIDLHSPDTNILPDKDLPWAQVLMPVTAGSGGANFAQSPAINQGDTVSIAFFDDDMQMPIITGILPRTEKVSTADPQGATTNGFIPTSAFTENRNRLSSVDDGESNQSNKKSQLSPEVVALSAAAGTPAVLTDTCDLTAYKSNAVTNEINSLLEEISRFGSDIPRLESLISSTVDRVHALVNPYVGEMFNNLFEALQPVLNAGLTALYNKVFAIVLASTGGNVIAARLAAEAALVALQPAILALQEAIQMLANEVVTNMLGKVEDLIRDTVSNNDSFSSCAGTQFNAALVNSIISDIDTGILPLIGAVASVLSGGFDAANAIRSTVDLVRSFAGGLTGPNQGGNKCGGMVKEYVFGSGAKEDLGDVLDLIMDAANQAKAIADSGTAAVGAVGDVIDSAATAGAIVRQFGDFPFLSDSSGKQSFLNNCSAKPPETCYAPEVILFGGRGKGAKGKAYVGSYVDSDDNRTVTNKRGGVVTIEVKDGGEGYVYPPFVEVRDNCKLGIGCNARAIVKNGKVTSIYVVTPGEGYVSTEESPEFIVKTVEVVNGGSGYVPGIYSDQYGGEYQVTVDDISTGGTGNIVEILPINYVQIPGSPGRSPGGEGSDETEFSPVIINIPRINPPIPPGGRIDRETREVFNAEGRNLGVAKVGKGLQYQPILVPAPTAEQVAAGDIPVEVVPRLLQPELIQVVDCPD